VLFRSGMTVLTRIMDRKTNRWTDTPKSLFAGGYERIIYS